ncbi:MAG: hypothetical protein QM652_05615 [Legionella sp.]
MLVVDARVFLGEGLFETLKVEQAKPRYTTMHCIALAKAKRLRTTVY